MHVLHSGIQNFLRGATCITPASRPASQSIKLLSQGLELRMGPTVQITLARIVNRVPEEVELGPQQGRCPAIQFRLIARGFEAQCTIHVAMPCLMCLHAHMIYHDSMHHMCLEIAVLMHSGESQGPGGKNFFSGLRPCTLLVCAV